MTKESELDALAAAVRDFIDQEVPTATQWNVNPDVLRQSLTKLGDFMTAIETAHAALQALFEANHDPGTGANPVPGEWVVDTATPTFLNASQLSLPGDRRADYVIGHRIRCLLSGSPVVVALTNVTYNGGSNVTTLQTESAVLTSGLTQVSYGLVRSSVPKVQGSDILAATIAGSRLIDLTVEGGKIADLTIPGGKLVNAAIDTAQLKDSAVSMDKLAHGAVSTLKLANAAVTEEKLGNNAVTALKIALQAVGSTKLGIGASLSGSGQGGSIGGQSLTGTPTDYATVALTGPLRVGGKILVMAVSGVNITAAPATFSYGIYRDGAAYLPPGTVTLSPAAGAIHLAPAALFTATGTSHTFTLRASKSLGTISLQDPQIIAVAFA